MGLIASILNGQKTLTYQLPYFSLIALSINSLSLFLAFLTILIWVIVSFYAAKYMEKERICEYYIFSFLALFALLGVFFAANFFTLFVFFDLLGYAVYMLVINSRTREALKAGTKYLVMAILGDLTLLVGIFLYYYYTGGVSFVAKSLPDNLALLIFLLMGVGFAIKAGLIPFHIWLPEAHPAAPCPASALLSGLVIKAGVYGLIRSYLAIFGLKNAFKFLGLSIIWFGVASMVFGVLMALLQKNAKKMLAYHSISQVGYIVLGLGCAVYLGKEGGLALGGGLFHLMNHALFKASLFLSVGAIYFMTDEVDIYKLGGLFKRMPLTAASLIIAACGISGVPLFNGFASKTLLHQSLTLVTHGYLLEIVFLFTGAATFCSFLKLVKLSLFSKEPGESRVSRAKEAPVLMWASNFVLSVLIIIIGFFPNLIWQNLLKPSLAVLGYPVVAFSVSIWHAQDLISFLIAALLGTFIYFVGIKYHLFEFSFPQWFSLNYWAEKLAFNFYFVAQRGRILESGIHMPELKLAREMVESYEEELRLVSKIVKSVVLNFENFGVRFYQIILDSCRVLVIFGNSLVKTWFLSETLAIFSASKREPGAKDYRKDLEISIFMILLFLLIFLAIN